VFVQLTNRSDVVGQVFATVVINGHAVTRLSDGIAMAYVPAHTTSWAMVYLDNAGPTAMFRRLDSVSIDCTPFRL